MIKIWISTHLDGIIVGIISSAIIAGVGFAINRIYSYIKVRKSEYTGKWEQLIYASGDEGYEGEIVKQDQYDIKHTKLKYSGRLVSNIRGTIQRVSPTNQRHRRWDCIGYLDGEVLTILYQSMEAQKSRGCIYLRLFKDFEFRGYYLEEHKDGTIDKTPVIIRKVVNLP